MACSRFEYVKAFERYDRLLPGCWAVIRLDGRSFTKFANKHNFSKPNDQRALHLCNAAAKHVVSTFDDHIAFAYGESDEFSFVLQRQSTLFSRRESKILSTVVSLFTSAYVMYWNQFMQDTLLLEPPCFDARIVLYPTTRHLRDYLSWRQADTHVNNLFNTAFWALVTRGGLSVQEAEKRLKGTLAKDKNEILFSQFGINYNNEPLMFRKGSFVMKSPALVNKEKQHQQKKKRRIDHNRASAADAHNAAETSTEGGGEKDKYLAVHVDIIGDSFWKQYPHLLAPSDLEPPRIRKPGKGD